jgi:hypothetical protein
VGIDEGGFEELTGIIDGYKFGFKLDMFMSGV